MEILAAFILAFIVSTLLVRYRQGSLANLIIFFVLLFLAAISSQFLIPPFGPVLWGITWVPMFASVLFVAIIFLLLRLLTKKKKDDTSQEHPPLL